MHLPSVRKLADAVNFEGGRQLSDDLEPSSSVLIYLKMMGDIVHSTVWKGITPR